MKTAQYFLITGYSGAVSSIANINWEFWEGATGTALHVISAVSIIIGIFLKWDDIKTTIKKRFTKSD